ncbi:agmatinase [Jannaschia aquimarina]|uniref:SpeB protein n=1 Tax=Jannaschia aquimarina TaxID=935700 RepID=A0A0D1EH88_9RHOB|nr:agmatinase [Jannaschia aquimarina]KIT15205.1 Agmatinase [Jannaschia aquimarina]SNT32944.1 agmatinase [Jannaschia aquimarina]
MALLQDARDQVDRAFTGGSKGLDMENAFGGALSAFRRRYTRDLTDYDLAITGVPFDQAVTHRPGSRFGPRAVREASTLQVFDPPWGWDGFSPLEELAIADYGDAGFDYAQVSEFPGALRDHIRGILAQGAGCLSIGGDHYVSFPILQAHAEKYGPLALIQFDAHSDTWPDDDMDRIDHGTMFYKAVKSGIVDPERSIQVGIRTVNADPLGVETITARDVRELGTAEVAARIRARVGQHPAYLTFDIDGLDPAFAPGTGTPVWGGLTSGQAADILRDIAGINLVGGDVVEVAPQYDPSGGTAVAAAHVLMELICLWGWTRR